MHVFMIWPLDVVVGNFVCSGIVVNGKFIHMLRVLILILLTACSRGPEAFREDAQGIMRAMVKEFKRIHGREELMEREPRIQLLFDKLVAVVVEAKVYMDRHPEFESLEFKWKDQDLSDELRGELNRLYRLEGCREIIEGCEKRALRQSQEILDIQFPTLK